MYRVLKEMQTFAHNIFHMDLPLIMEFRNKDDQHKSLESLNSNSESQSLTYITWKEVFS